jgi:hypothetical protein
MLHYKQLRDDSVPIHQTTQPHGQVVSVSHHFYEILSSNLGMRDGFLDWGSTVVFSSHSKQMVT